jgi:TRAP-type C4-dicarboxylate transport system substrate-binding protein
MGGKENQMKRRAVYMTLAVLALSSSLAYGQKAPTPQPAKKITLKFVDQWKPDQWIVAKATEVFNEVSKRSKGRLEIIRAGGPEVIPAQEQLNYCGKGAVDIILAPPSYYKGTVPESLILGLPVVDWNFDDVVELTNAVADDLDKIYQKKTNTRSLMFPFSPAGIYVFTKTKPVNSVADMKGLKIRSPGGLEDLLLKELGSAATKIASSEIYTAAERGTIDGAVRPAQAVLDWREYEVWKYMLSTPLCFMITGSILINDDSFNRLPRDLQKLLLDTVKEQGLASLRYFRDLEMKAVNQMNSKGVKVVDLSPGEKTKWHSSEVRVAEKYFLDQCPENGKLLLDKLKAAAK